MRSHILVVESCAKHRVMLKLHLTEAFYATLLAADAATCDAIIRDKTPDLILLNLDLPDHPGLSLLARLRANPALQEVVIIALTTQEDHPHRVAAFDAGADDVLSLPLDVTVLLSRMRCLLRQPLETHMMAQAWGGQLSLMRGMAEPAPDFARPQRLALITGAPVKAFQWRCILPANLRPYLRILARDDVSRDLAGEGGTPPDMFLIEAQCDGASSGLALLTQLRHHPDTRHSLKCLIAPTDDTATVTMALELGADDVIAPNISAQELAARLHLLFQRKRRYDAERNAFEDGLRMALVDPLTGAFNRRSALPNLAKIALQAQEDRSQFAVMVLDLDRFKQVNDQLGHAAGDLILIEVVRRLAVNLRPDDLLARYGGEEFLIVIPHCDFTMAETMAERLRHAISNTPMMIDEGIKSTTITASIGFALSDPSRDAPKEIDNLLARADLAMRRAKKSGRNLVSHVPIPA